MHNKIIIAGMVTGVVGVAALCTFGFMSVMKNSDVDGKIENIKKAATDTYENAKEIINTEAQTSSAVRPGIEQQNEQVYEYNSTNDGNVTESDYYAAVNKLYNTNDVILIKYDTGEVGQLSKVAMTVIDAKYNTMELGVPSSVVGLSGNILLYGDLTPNKDEGRFTVESIYDWDIEGARDIHPADVLVCEMDNVTIKGINGDKVYIDDCFEQPWTITIDKNNRIIDCSNNYYSECFVYKGYSSDYDKVSAEYESAIEDIIGGSDVMETAVDNAIEEMIKMYKTDSMIRTNTANTDGVKVNVDDINADLTRDMERISNEVNSSSIADIDYQAGELPYGGLPTYPVSKYLEKGITSDTMQKKLDYISSLKGKIANSMCIDYEMVDAIKDFTSESGRETKYNLQPGESTERYVVLHERFENDYYYCILNITNDTNEEQYYDDCKVSEVKFP